MRVTIAALALLLAVLPAGPAGAAEPKNFAVRGGSGASAYEGSVRVTVLTDADDTAVFMDVQWTFGAYVIRGYGVVAKDDPDLLTVSYVVPVGLGVGRYKLQPDGGAVGTLVGEKGIFVTETWTPLGAAPAASLPVSPPQAAGPAMAAPQSGRGGTGSTSK